MTAEQAIRRLLDFARKDAPPDLVEAIGMTVDHVRGLEQALELIQNGVDSAMRNRPPNAVNGKR